VILQLDEIGRPVRGDGHAIEELWSRILRADEARRAAGSNRDLHNPIFARLLRVIHRLICAFQQVIRTGVRRVQETTPMAGRDVRRPLNTLRRLTMSRLAAASATCASVSASIRQIRHRPAPHDVGLPHDERIASATSRRTASPV